MNLTIINYILVTACLVFSNINCYCPDENDNHDIRFYYRRTAGTNDYETYMDEFKITNYTNKTVVIKDLYEYAQHYVDTMKANKRIGYVTFIGEKPCETLPNDPAEDPFNTEKKRYIIGFGFDSFLKKNIHKKKIELNAINVSISKTEGKVYYMQFSKDKHFIDSILSSKKPFASDF